MLKLTLVSGRLDRLAKLIDTDEYEIEISTVDQSRDEQDDSPTDEMEVIPALTDD